MGVGGEATLSGDRVAVLYIHIVHRWKGLALEPRYIEPDQSIIIYEKYISLHVVD